MNFGTVFVKIFKPGSLKEFPFFIENYFLDTYDSLNNFAGLFVCLFAGKSVLWIYLRRCQWIFACSMGLHMGVHGFINGIQILLWNLLGGERNL